MRLLVDLQACQGPSGERGIGYYSISLARALAEQRGPHEVKVLLDGAAPAETVLAVRERLSPLLGRQDIVLVPHASVGADQEAVREAVIAAAAPDVLLVTSVFELPETSAMSMRDWCARAPVAAVLHDLIPLGDLDRWKPGRQQRAEYLNDVDRLAAVDLLLTNSDYTAREAQRLLPACPPTRTIWGAAPAAATASAPHPTPRSGFALAVGRDEPHKDVRTAVLAWASLPSDVRGDRAFVVVGPWQTENREKLCVEAEGLGLPRTQLQFIDSVSDAGLSWLYQHAGVFIFPSLQEGLGLPPLEAMAVGAPTLLARGSSLAELVDGDEPYFTPGAIGELSSLLARVLQEPALRERLKTLGGRATRRFTWAASAERTWRALEQLSMRPRLAGRSPLLIEGGEAIWDAADEVAYVLEDVQGWARHRRDLQERPGVAVVGVLPPPGLDAGLLLAACPAVIPRTPEIATALLRAGVVCAPMAVHGDVEQVATHGYDTDLPGHWARAAATHGLAVPPGPAVIRRPLWSNRLRPPLLASDITWYRTTAFLSGIQRATLRLHGSLTELVAGVGGAVVPVRLGESPPGTPHPAIAADPVLAANEVRPDEPDWLLCLDLDDRLARASGTLQAARAAGVGVATNVFDLLPWAHPEWWPAGAAEASFLPWLRAALRVSDVLLVNSVATASEVERFLREEPLERPDGFSVQLLRLGADLASAPVVSSEGRESDHFLMVGTVEPRKGHAEVLDAFERLWSKGVPARLTVLGRTGWMVDDVVARMETLTSTQPLFAWLKNAPDRELDRLYGCCSAVLLASHGEGFGLPVVEAAVRGCPVVVRDIPVLRELAGDNATYFDDNDGRPLAQVLTQVLREGAAVPSLDRVHTWDEVGRRLLSILENEVAPIARWSPSTGWTWL